MDVRHDLFRLGVFRNGSGRTQLDRHTTTQRLVNRHGRKGARAPKNPLEEGRKRKQKREMGRGKMDRQPGTLHALTRGVSSLALIL